jgi:LCP family protein required for cell wall assembly
MTPGPEIPEDHEPPRYKRYRAGPQLPWRREAASSPREQLRELRGGGGRGGRGGWRGGRGGWRGGRRGLRGPWTLRRGLRWLALVLGVWIALSIVLFLLSAQFAAPSVSDAAKRALDSGGLLPFSAENVLVLGSDQRTGLTHEPGASTSGPSRSDVMLLIRTGGGHSARLSIPRDTVVPIPGHGTTKINAAYAFGGAALAIQTVKSYLGIKINHIVEINFDHFPQLIDAMGGVDVTLNTCVVSLINGGFRNGGYTLRLHKGSNHLDGKQALALARTRHNLCHANDSDLDRVKRQQELFNAMKRRLLSASTLFRLPFVSWQAPQALKSDMGGPTLMALFAALEIGGSPAPKVLTPDGSITLPDGSVGLSVSDATRRAAVQQFLSG